MQKQLERNITLFKIEAAFVGLTQVWAPVFVIYQMIGIGLSLPQVLIGETVLFASSFLFELPSGIFADLLGRKKTLLLQSVFMLLTIFIFLNSTSLFGVLIAQIFFGLSMALQSGTHESLFYDSLKNLNKEKLYKKINGENRSIMQIFTVIGTVSSGFFASINISLPLIIAALTTLCILITRFIMMEAKYKMEEQHPFKHLIKSFKFTYKYKKIRNILLFFGIIATSSTLLFNTLNPLFELKGIPIWSFGIIFAGFSFVSALLSKYAHKIEKIVGLNKSMFGLYFVSILGFTLLWGVDIGVLTAILFPAIIRANQSFTEIVIGDALHREIASHHRATVMSIKGSVISILTFPAMLALASSTNSFGLINSYGLIALFTMILAGYFLNAVKLVKRSKS